MENGEVVLLEESSKDAADETAAEDEDHGVTAAILIDARPRDVWDFVADKEAAPDYIDSLESAEVIEETEEHVLIRQVMKLGPLPRISYVVKHSPTPPHTVNFERHSGDLKKISGFWKFLPVEDGRKCLLVYRLSLKPGFLVPNFVVRNSLRKSLPDALRTVREQVKKGGGD